MSKVLYIFKLTEDDIGPKEHVRNILKYSLHDIDVVTNGFNDIWEIYLKKCIVDKTNSTFLNILLFQIYTGIYVIKNRKKYDTILLRQSVGFFLLPLLSRIIGLNIVVEVNGFQYQDLLDRDKKIFANVNKFLEYVTFKSSNKIVCVHENIKYNLLASFSMLKYRHDKIYIVENGIETTKYIEASSSKKIWNISVHQFRIGYLGSFSHREGVDFLPKIAKKLLDKTIKFVIIGGTSNDISEFKRNIVNLDVEEQFELTPYLPLEDALDRLKTCDICIHLRRPISGKTNSQGSPLKMLDYHNIGRCVIASDIDSYQYIKDNDFGYLVNMNSNNFIDEIVSIINRLKNNTSIVKKGKNAYKYIENKTWKNQIKKLDLLLEKY